MLLGPVFRHEMLAAGRKRRYFVATPAVGLGMLMILGMAHTAIGGAGDGLSIAGAARLSASFYAMFAWSTMLGVLVVTPVVVAGAIASERERRTIEYLFATDLSGREIVLDKLAARLLTIGKLVVATLPVLAIFRLMGGVPGGLLLWHFAMLASTATVTAALSLVVSVYCERAREAASQAIGLVFLWIVSFPMAWSLLFTLDAVWGAGASEGYVVPVMWWGAANPLFVLLTSAGVGGGALGVGVNGQAIGLMIALHTAASAVLVAFAAWSVRRVHLRAASTAVKGPKPGRAKRRRPPYQDHPMLWKECHAASLKRRAPRWAWRIGRALLVLTIAAALGESLWRELTTPRLVEGYDNAATMIGTTCGSLILLAIGARAAGLIAHERERETLLSLLTSDLSAGEIVRAKLLGNLYAFRWGVAGVVAMPLLGAVLNPWMALAAVGVLAVMATVGTAATAIGLAYSLRMKSSAKAVGATIMTLLGVALAYPAIATYVMATSGLNEEALAVLAWPPLAPMLLAIPMICAVNPSPGFIAVTLVCGMLFYAVGALLVTQSLVDGFDPCCQRGAPSTPRPSPNGDEPLTTHPCST